MAVFRHYRNNKIVSLFSFRLLLSSKCAWIVQSVIFCVLVMIDDIGRQSCCFIMFIIIMFMLLADVIYHLTLCLLVTGVEASWIVIFVVFYSTNLHRPKSDMADGSIAHIIFCIIVIIFSGVAIQCTSTGGSCDSKPKPLASRTQVTPKLFRIVHWMKKFVDCCSL